MAIDDYRDRPFRISENEDGADGGIEFNPFDSGKTETAWVDIVDDETETLRARVSVQVHRQPIPHTDSEERVFSENDVSVELFDVNKDEEVPEEIIEKLLDETDALQHLRGICSAEDQEDRFSEEE